MKTDKCLSDDQISDGGKLGHMEKQETEIKRKLEMEMETGNGNRKLKTEMETQLLHCCSPSKI